MKKANINPLQKKFSEMIETLQAGNISDFRPWLKKLNKLNLVYFILYCDQHKIMNIYEIEKHLTN